MAANLAVNLYPKPTVGQTDERLAVSSTAVAFSTAWKTSKNENRFVVLDIQTDDVMVTFDGSDPTSSNGHRLYVGQSYTWHVDTAVAAKFIRVTNDAVVHASGFTY